MVRLLTAVQKVEVVGGESWLSHDLGPLLLAVAAISAAALAAWVATRNHRQQLENDRQLRNQDHIRNTIDAAVAVTNETHAAVNAFLGSVVALEFRRRDREAKESSSSSPLRWSYTGDLDAEAADIANPDMMSVQAATDRLEMRLGAGHPIVTSHRAVRDALLSIFVNLVPGRTANRAADQLSEDSARTKALQENLGSFRKACYAWFNE